MDQYDVNNMSDGFQADPEQSPQHEDDIIGNMSPSTEEKNAVHQYNSSESHIPNLLDMDDHQFDEHSDIPHEDLHPVVQNGASPLDKEDDDFDFEKKLPEIPHGNQRNESETQMKFSTTHFQDDEPAVEEYKENKHSPQPEIKEEDYSNADVEEEEEEQEEVVEPEQEVYNLKPQEKAPETVLPKLEEISTPPPSHRSPSPVIVEEPKHEALSKSPDSPVEKLISTSPNSQPEPKAPLVEPIISAEPFKTRSVKSTKSEGAGRSFLVVDLVYWRDPRKSGIVLGAVLAILLSLSVVSVVSVISYSALAVLTGTLSFRLYKNVLQAVQKTQDGHPFKEYLEKDVTVTSEKVHEVADVTAAKLNATLLELRRLFLVEDLVDSVKFALILWAFTYVGSWFNGLTLVILGVVGLFSLPKVYETHQEKIDQNVDLVRGKINEIVDKIQAVLPIGKKVKSQ